MTEDAPQTEPLDRGARATLLTYLLLMTAITIPFLVMMAPYTIPVLTAALLAVLVDPLYLRIRSRGTGARTAALAVTLGLILLVLAPLAWFISTALEQAIGLVTSIMNTSPIEVGQLTDRLTQWRPLARIMSNPAAFQQRLTDAAVTVASFASNIALKALGSVPAYVLDGVICAITVYFLLVDGRRLFSWVTGKLPLPTQIRDTMALAFRRSTVAVILASVAAAATQAAIMLIAFVALGLPVPQLAAFSAFILAWIPAVGIVPVWLIGMIGLWFDDRIVAMFLLLGAGLLAGGLDNVVRPLVLRGRQQMHPLLALLAIFGGIALFGIVGVFLGPVLATMVVTFWDTWPAVARHCGVPVAESGSVEEVELAHDTDLHPPPELPAH
jgi:predicted PurR-regulated permease PerM